MKTDESAFRIAATNRPSQIAIQQALLLDDQQMVVDDQGTLGNMFHLCPGGRHRDRSHRGGRGVPAGRHVAALAVGAGQ